MNDYRLKCDFKAVDVYGTAELHPGQALACSKVPVGDHGLNFRIPTLSVG
jgi:hypothetical protein